jgi:prepilin-type N-terminal cleavage/methylation domain-containing protein
MMKISDKAKTPSAAPFGFWILDFGFSNVKPRKGFTLIELLVVVAILAVLGALIAVSMARYTRTQALAGVLGAVVSQLEDARSRTLSSQGGSQYGVHLETGGATLFRGDTYDQNDPLNETTPLDSRVTLAVSLSGGGEDVVFERLTGETEDHGTAVLTIAAPAALSKTITIQETGVISND